VMVQFGCVMFNNTKVRPRLNKIVTGNIKQIRVT